MGLLDGGSASDDNASCWRRTGALVRNLTSSYTDQSNEVSMVSASVLMFVLAALFFNINLFSGLSDVSAILDPKVRILLSKALSLFLPVMSYLFSEAKNAGLACYAAASADGPPELSLRARLILTWMLLVELLRNKVEEISMQGWHAATVERAGRVVWLGSLVFFNLHGAGRKSVFGILWLLCAAKLVQRIAFTEVGKRSFAYGMNARLITSYMARILHEDEDQQQEAEQHGWELQHAHGDELLKKCRYAVMGEEKLVIAATSAGHMLTSDMSAVVTVGKIWDLAETDELFTSLDKNRRLRKLCLSFALFKMLRRSFEQVPTMAEAEARNCRDLIFKGLYNSDADAGGDGAKDGEDKAESLFQVLNDEANFLSEYYHSVIPVVLASPVFLLANYVVLPLLACVVCLMIIVLCGNGDVLFAFSSMQSDNYTMSFGVTKMARCILSRVTTSPTAFFSTIDFSITSLLFLILAYEEVWELVVFLLSNWFTVSLLYEYTSKPHWHNSHVFGWAIRRILWVRSKMSHPDLSFKQLSVLRSCRLSLMLPGTVALTLPILPTVLVPKEVKHSIVEYMAATSASHGGDGATRRPSNGGAAVTDDTDLWFAFKSGNIAEVILTWHVATSLFEFDDERDPSAEADRSRSFRHVATTLSEYCAYLVAFHRELLPDNQESTELAFEDLKCELRDVLGFWGYYLPSVAGSTRGRHDKILALAKVLGKALAMVDMTVLQKGASLGLGLQAKAAASEADAVATWKVLADVWVQLVVYVASASDEELVTGHKKVLPEGGEFVTVLWALATHTGLSRPAAASTAPTPAPAAVTTDGTVKGLGSV